MAPTLPFRTIPDDRKFDVHDVACSESLNLANDESVAESVNDQISKSSTASDGKETASKKKAADEQQAEKAMRESQRLITIGRMTAEIAHEINNPLEAVSNLLYLALHEQGIAPRAVEFLQLAERELDRVIQISKQTLSFSRESAKAVPVRLAELMDEVVSLYARRITNKKLTLVREYATSAPVVAFPGEIRQVLSNLVTNAIEACHAGGTLRLRIRDAHHHSQAGIRVTVADNGTGIPQTARERLGEMFFSTKGESGTGLGLWVTNAIVARYGGVMRLRSSTDEATHGTTFSIFLPTASNPSPLAQPTASENVHHSIHNVTEIAQHPDHSSHAQGYTRSSRSHQRKG